MSCMTNQLVTNYISMLVLRYQGSHVDSNLNVASL